MFWCQPVTNTAVNAILYTSTVPRLRPVVMGASSDVISRCQAGDVSAFRELYGQHSRSVARRLSFLVARADVEDVLQDVFIEVFKSIGRFEGKSQFTTWLYRVTVHVAMKSRRKHTRSRVDIVEDVPDVADDKPAPDTVSLSAERQVRVEAMLEKLAPKKRAVLVMHDLQGMDASEIAEVLDTNVLTVRTRLFYARREIEVMAKADPALSEFFGGES